MSLSFNMDGENTPMIVPMFHTKTSIESEQRSRPSGPTLKLYSTLKSVSDFFNKYESTRECYATNIRHHFDASLYMKRSFYLENQATQLETMQLGIDEAKSLINDDPVSAMQSLSAMVTTIYDQMDRKKFFEIGNILLQNMLIEMSSEIQVLKNDINAMRERKDPSSERCKASPIYIPRKI